MPAYDMACNACQHIFEIRRSMRDSSPVPCPACGQETRQLFSSFPAVFTRKIDHPDSPLDEAPGHEKMRKQADWAINKALGDMGMSS